MLELDLLLQGFLDRHLSQLTRAECALLEGLLEYPDQELMEYLLGRAVPADQEVAGLVAKIRTTTY